MRINAVSAPLIVGNWQCLKTGIFKRSSYNSTITMDGSAKVYKWATGATQVEITNNGGDSEQVYFESGVSAQNAEDGLSISSGAATAGTLIGSNITILDRASGDEYFAVANAVSGDTQSVQLIQGKS